MRNGTAAMHTAKEHASVEGLFDAIHSTMRKAKNLLRQEIAGSQREEEAPGEERVMGYAIGQPTAMKQLRVHSFFP